MGLTDTCCGRHLDRAAPKAVIFDLDGVLIISSVDFKKFRDKLLRYIASREADMSRYDPGDTTVRMIAQFEREMMARGLPESEVHRYLAEIDSFLDEIELENIDKTRPAPGARELLSVLKDRDIRIGVLTRGCPSYADRALQLAGLARYIDAVVSRDRRSGIAPKPDPASALRLLDMLGVDPADSIMVGDHSIDYECARDAGVLFFGMTSGEKSLDSLRECGCPVILNDLFELKRLIGDEPGSHR